MCNTRDFQTSALQSTFTEIYPLERKHVAYELHLGRTCKTIQGRGWTCQLLARFSANSPITPAKLQTHHSLQMIRLSRCCQISSRCVLTWYLYVKELQIWFSSMLNTTLEMWCYDPFTSTRRLHPQYENNKCLSKWQLMPSCCLYFLLNEATGAPHEKSNHGTCMSHVHVSLIPGEVTPCQIKNHVQRKFATPILYAIDIFTNYDFFSLHT